MLGWQLNRHPNMDIVVDGTERRDDLWLTSDVRVDGAE